jgi:hypothetical protein
MARSLEVSSYTASVAQCSRGFNEWRRNIIIRTTEASTFCDVRFVDNPVGFQSIEAVRENGASQVYLPVDAYSSTLDLLRNEKPLYIVLYGSSTRVILQTGSEPPGEAE